MNKLHKVIALAIEKKVNVLSYSIDYKDVETAYVIAHDPQKDEYIVWNYNVVANGFYNGSYHWDENEAIKQFTKRIER